MSFTVQTSRTGGDSANLLQTSDIPRCWIQRVVVKSKGVVMKVITNYDIFKKIMTLAYTTYESKSEQELYLALSDTNKAVVGESQDITSDAFVPNVLKFGISSQHLSSYLHLHLLGKSSTAFDIELTLAPDHDVSENHLVDGQTTVAIAADYYIMKEPSLNLCLLRVDEFICGTYSNITRDENKTSAIP